jgi:hypothetical protein
VPQNEPEEERRSPRQYSFCAAQQFLAGTWLTAATHPGDLAALIELRLTHLTSHLVGDRLEPRAAARAKLLTACKT